jgi:hypothetical protein
MAPGFVVVAHRKAYPLWVGGVYHNCKGQEVDG